MYLMMKSHVYDPKKHIITPDWYVSEKLDGRYFFWDGGATSGMPAKEVPWANCIKDKQEFTSTGLWSSQGKVIHAPNTITGQLPPVLLDGEIWEGRGQFQSTMSKTRRYDDTHWDGVSLKLFGMPTVQQFTIPRTLKYLAGDVWFNGVDTDKIRLRDADKRYFEQVVKEFRFDNTYSTTNVKPVEYKTIKESMYEFKCLDIQSTIGLLLKAVLEIKGEGLIIRAPWNYWRPDRLHDILKIKPFNDAEGEVIGFTSGRETDKGSTLLGKIGAYIIKTDTDSIFKGGIFELSGMTHEERTFDSEEAIEWAISNPGKEMPLDIINSERAFGKRITFRYRELTKDNLPKEARYLRPRSEED